MSLLLKLEAHAVPRKVNVSLISLTDAQVAPLLDEIQPEVTVTSTPFSASQLLPTKPPEPFLILAFDQFLDDISRCFIQRDLALWRKRMELPLSIISRHGMIELSTEEAVAENFGLYLQACDVLKLDSINRSIVSLEDCGDGTFLGTYLTMLMSRGELAAEPYESSVIFSLKHKEFRMTSVMNGRGHAEWTGVTDR